METSPQSGVIEQLIAWGNGHEAALDELIPAVYQELRRMADRYLRCEDLGHTLQTTALVQEASLKSWSLRRG